MNAVALGVFDTSGGNTITAIDISDDNQIILAGDDRGIVTLFDAASGRINQTYRMGRELIFLSFLSNRTFLALDTRGNIKIYDISTNRVEHEFSTDRQPEMVSIDRTKRYLAVANNRSYIELFDLVAMMPVGRIDAREQIRNLAYLNFDRLGQQIIAVTERSEAYSWNPSTLSLVRNITLRGNELHGSRNVVKSASSNMQSNIFVVGLQEVAIPRGGIQASRDLTRQNYIIGYDWNTGIELRRININQEVKEIIMGPGGNHVAVTSRGDDQLYIADMQQGEIVNRIAIPGNTNVLHISGNGQLLSAGQSNGRVNVWSLEYQETRALGETRLPSISGRVRALSTSEPLLNQNFGSKLSLAILDVESRGIEQHVADIAMFSLSNSLSNHSYMELVERSQIEQIIQEQEFQLGDLTQDQGVRIGQLLNVDYVLLATMGRLGSNIIVNGRVVSVETGQVIGGREVICETCQEQDILEAVSMLSRLIAQ